MAETFDYLKKNMEITELLGSMGFNALKALLTTIPIIGAFLAVERVLYPSLTLYSWAILSLFIILAVSAMIFIIHSWIGEFDLKKWVFTPRISHEDIGVAIIFSWLVAIAVTVFVTVFRDLLYALLYLTPLSVLPFLAFLYMFRFKYERVGPRIFWCLIYGYGFGAGLKALGMLLVLLVDVIGWQFTALGIVCEVLISAFYLYIDLTEWVRADIEGKITHEQFLEQAAEVETMREIAKRIRP